MKDDSQASCQHSCFCSRPRRVGFSLRQMASESKLKSMGTAQNANMSKGTELSSILLSRDFVRTNFICLKVMWKMLYQKGAACFISRPSGSVYVY